MPARTRKRKPKRRRRSSRKKARRRRPASYPLVNTPSSDEDFVLDGEESSTGEEYTEQEEDTDEDEESEEDENLMNDVRNSDANLGSSARRRRYPNRTHDGLANASSLLSQPRYLQFEDHLALEDERTGAHADRTSHRTRVRRQRQRQDSSDEDFEVDREMMRETGVNANEAAVGSRPLTRAQVSDLLEGGAGNFRFDSFEFEDRGFSELHDLPHGAGAPPLSTRNPHEANANFIRSDSGVVNDSESDKGKGKEKALEGETKATIRNEETTALVCGICLTEIVVAERGKLDSCDHFFCFGCIMEWAKVESRCPMCKQRFTTIAIAGIGVSKRTRTIRIPLRDQVYIPPEDSDLPLEDPYADVVCMECQGTGDEGLLLLCDRCDSAAHTFCVGLGRSVPRGDWYCRDCQALTGGISDSEDEPEETLFASGNEEEEEEENDDDSDDREDGETESLLRSIVASVNPRRRHTRQARVERRSTSTSSSLSLPRNVRGRLWQRLSRRQRGRHIAAPQLSQAARALLSSTSSELNQTAHTSGGPQNGSARTVPQQRRLHERINEMRNNWGRIQNGDLHFDALRIGATGPIQSAVLSNSHGGALRTGVRVSTPQAVLSNSNGAALRTEARGPLQQPVSSNATVGLTPQTPSIVSSGSNKKDVDSVGRSETSRQGEKELERAWRMMGHAQNLSTGIGNSKSQQQKLGGSPSWSVSSQARHLTENASSCATSNLVSPIKNLEMLTCNGPASPPRENGSAGTSKPGSSSVQGFSTLKHDDVLTRQVPRPIVPLALTGECRKEELAYPSNSKETFAPCKSPISFGKDPHKTVSGKHTVSEGFKTEPFKSGRQFKGKDISIIHTFTEDMKMKDKQDVSAARSSTSSLPDGLKVHLTELVKKQTWPVYITEGLDKDQFKRIARAAVHSLLALCDPNNKSTGLSCVHFEDHGKNPVDKCCDKCLDEHVEKAVKNAKDKIKPS